MTLLQMRKRANLRQEDVAKRLNVDQSAVSRWEKGETKPLRKYHKKLARLYGVTVDELLSEDDETSSRGAPENQRTQIV